MGVYLGSIPVGITLSLLDPLSDKHIWQAIDIMEANLDGHVVFTDEEYADFYERYVRIVSVVLGGVDE